MTESSRPGASPRLTFFVWADTHFGYRPRLGDGDPRLRTIRQMRVLPGWPWPEPLEGVVDEPAFVWHCGDMIDGGEDAAREIALYEHGMRDLPWAHCEVMGNHDTAPEFVRGFEERWGGLSYSFDRDGAHFVSLNSGTDAKGCVCVPEKDLEFLARDVSAVDAKTPVLLATHCRLDAVANADAVREALGDARVSLVVSGHKHTVAAFEWEGLTCLDVGHCRDHPIDPVYARSFYVVRIGDGRIQAAPWRWDLEDWERAEGWADNSVLQSRFYLDAAL